jgi:hypothetical protein
MGNGSRDDKVGLGALLARLTAMDQRSTDPTPLVTPDGRYLVVRGRLWRTASPKLADEVKARLVRELMDARRGVSVAKREGDPQAEAAAHAAVDVAKRALGERGPVWWSDGAPDLNRHLARTGPYAAWYADAAKESDR